MVLAGMAHRYAGFITTCWTRAGPWMFSWYGAREFSHNRGSVFMTFRRSRFETEQPNIPPTYYHSKKR